MSPREAWLFRELLYFLVWRDVKVRYKQTLLGVAWAVLQPVLTMAVFTLFFGRLAGLGQRTGGIPYSVYVLTGLIPWMFFANAVTASSSSLVGSAQLITKVYFPRLLIPLAAVGAALVDLGVSMVVLTFFMGWFQILPSPWLPLLLPVLLVALVAAAAGIGSLTAALTVAYRDFRYLVPFGIQLWLFLTPVIYPLSIVPARWRWVLSLNPMTGLIEGFRAAFLGTVLEPRQAAISLVVTAALCSVGIAHFRRVERRFADIV